MGKQVILTEKPSVGQEISRGIPGNFTRGDGFLESDDTLITWAFGHLVQLEDPVCYDPRFKSWSFDTLPIIPDTFQYRIDSDKGRAKQFQTIKKLVQRSDVDRVVIAGDCGREGELIARLILAQAGCTKPMFRFWTSKSLTPDVVADTMAHLVPASTYDRLYRAALARQHSDWLVGINATRAFTVRLGDLFSLGRVQTPVLYLVCKREDEINNFKPDSYWLVKAKFIHASGSYEGLWFNPARKGGAAAADSDDGEGDKDNALALSANRIGSADEAKAIVSRTKRVEGTVSSVTNNKVSEAPPLLFSLTALQEEASKLYGFNLSETLEIAQELYEAKYITYPRTESQHLNDEMAAEVPKIIAALGSGPVRFDPALIKVDAKNKQVFDTTKLTDHHALIPEPRVPSGLAPRQQKIYELVVRRFLAAFYPHYETATTTIVTLVGVDHFETRGRTVLANGWRDIYGAAPSGKEVPPVAKGDPSLAGDVNAEKKQTKPPVRYTDGTLVKDMISVGRFVTDEKLRKVLKATAGLGQTATRAEIVATLCSRSYIERKKSGKSTFIHPTVKGLALISLVKDQKIADPGYTALWEQELEAVADGSSPDSVSFMAGIRSYVEEITRMALELPQEKVLELVAKVGITGKRGRSNMAREVVGKCPECGADVTDGDLSFSCSAYQAPTSCKFALWKDKVTKLGRKEALTADEAKKLLANETIELKGLLSKRTGKNYDCAGIMEKDPQWGWGIKLIFENNR